MGYNLNGIYVTSPYVATLEVCLIDLVYFSIITNINNFNINLSDYFNYIIYYNSKILY